MLTELNKTRQTQGMGYRDWGKKTDAMKNSAKRYHATNTQKGREKEWASSVVDMTGQVQRERNRDRRGNKLGNTWNMRVQDYSQETENKSETLLGQVSRLEQKQTCRKQPTSKAGSEDCTRATCQDPGSKKWVTDPEQAYNARQVSPKWNQKP